MNITEKYRNWIKKFHKLNSCQVFMISKQEKLMMKETLFLRVEIN